MASSEYRRVVELVDSALDLEAAARSEFLDRECADAPELRAEVESLLNEEVTLQSDFLGFPAALQAVDLMASEKCPTTDESGDEPNRERPDSVGPFRVLKELGRGGMGTVYLAEQREPIERRVALKVIHGFGGSQGTRRFAAECRALARLKHPNIAAVYDAGVADDDRAFVAMEWVEGSHITDWCDQHQLSIRARLELFLGVCAGVGHAHQKGLVHRDLKPTNVLVVGVDGKATAKVIDFGIARTLDEVDASTSVNFSRSEQAGDADRGLGHSHSLLMGSPIYMSPEAARLGDRSDVDTRTDVYSLGILLYELLVGMPPHDVSGLGIGAMLHQARTTDPPALSRRWANLDGDRQNQLADLRGVDGEVLERQLRGDLDAILAKATSRERDQRYGAVSELAADLNRHLQNRPVIARVPSLRYNLSRFLRRNVGAVIAVTVVVGVLVAGVLGRIQEAHRANLEAEKARLALVQAEQLSDFLIGLFEVEDPDRRADDPQSVDELLAKAEATIDEELAGQPLARARFLQTIGRIAMNRTELSRAANLYEQSLALREEHQPPGHPHIITTVGSLGVIYRRQGREAEAEAALTRAVELNESADQPDFAQLAATVTWLANLHYQQKRFEDAVAGHRRALEIRRQLPENAGAMGESLNNLSVALRDLGRYAEAKPILQEAEVFFSQALGPRHPLTVGCWLNMAGIEEKLGGWDEAEALLKRAAKVWEEVHGPNHHRTLLARRAIGSLWIRWHRAEEAVAHLQDLLQDQEENSQGQGTAAERREIARTRSVLGQALKRYGDLDGAEHMLRQGLESYSALLGSDHNSTNNVRAQMALVTWMRGDAARAVALLRSLVAKKEDVLGKSHPGVARMYQSLGRILLDEGRLDEAGQAFQRALSIHEIAQGGPSVHVGRDLLGLGRVRLQQGRNDEASRFLGRCEAIFEQLLPPDHPDLVAARAEAATAQR